ncbi:MAG: adenylyltransferase/cytidyltransferase family protein [Sulfitobacter sp.]
MIRLVARPARVVLTYGRFDAFHQGHISFLRRLAQTGDELIVGCTTDQLAAKIGTPCDVAFETRRARLESCRFVSRVITRSSLDQTHTDIVNYNACVLAVGADRTEDLSGLSDIVQVLRLPIDKWCKFDGRNEKVIPQVAVT